MLTKKILIIAPIVLIFFLLQSYFWVPSYKEQTKGNPKRLKEFITASIGDAHILNPILSADSSSSNIESQVFEGLIDRDEELRFRGRLAEKWSIYEEAYFYLNEDYERPGLGRMEAEEVIDLIQQTQKDKNFKDSELKRTLKNIEKISVIDPEGINFSTKTRQGEEVSVSGLAPHRIKLKLKQVDQHLFKNLEKILGQGYFSTFRAEKYVRLEPVSEEAALAVLSQQVLPATEHNPVIIFYLRPNIRFHDGHVFEANDVKFTYEAIMNPRNLSPRVADYEPVKQVEVIDPLTVKVVYKRLYSPAIGTWAMGILPQHLLNDEALQKEARLLGEDPAEFTLRQSGFGRHPIGCGPFVFQEWKADRFITLKRFQEYWEGAPIYENYVYRIIPDLLTQEMEFYAGTIDNYGVQPHQVKRLARDERYQHFSGLSFGYTYIGYNLRRKPFDDPRVRRALGMAINVDDIISYVLYDQGEPITGPFVKQTDYYNHRIKPLPYDPEGALKLLAEAGWKRNSEGWLEKNGQRLRFTLITNSGNDLRKAILAIAQNAWRKIGVEVRTDLLEWAVFIQERVNKLDFDALILGWSMGIEPDLYQIWHSSQTKPNQLNFVGFQNQEADDLIVQIRQEYDHDQQVQYCHRLHEIIAGEQPYTFLYVGKWSAVLDKRIVIKEQDREGNIQYKKITPTKTGSYSFHFNKWIKLSDTPDFDAGE